MKKTVVALVTFTPGTSARLSRKTKNAHQEMFVLRHIRQSRNNTTPKTTANVSAPIGPIPYRNARIDNSARMPIARKKFRQSWSTITSKTRIFTCFTTRPSSVSWTWLNMKRTSAFMPTTGRITEEILPFIHTNPSLVSTGKPNKWFTTTFVDAKVELDATCVTDGNNSPTTRYFTRPVNVRIRTAEKGRVPIITQKNKEGSLIHRWPTSVSSLCRKTEWWKEFSRMQIWRQDSFQNPNLRRSDRWFTKKRRPTVNQCFRRL